MGDVAKGIKSFKKGLSEDDPEKNQTQNTETQSSTEEQSSKEDSNLENK
jgi:Sec-independent protein translocase protein TatA